MWMNLTAYNDWQRRKKNNRFLKINLVLRLNIETLLPFKPFNLLHEFLHFFTTKIARLPPLVPRPFFSTFNL